MSKSILLEGPKSVVDILRDVFERGWGSKGYVIECIEELDDVGTMKITSRDEEGNLDGEAEDIEMDMGMFGGQPGTMQPFRTNVPSIIRGYLSLTQMTDEGLEKMSENLLRQWLSAKGVSFDDSEDREALVAKGKEHLVQQFLS